MEFDYIIVGGGSAGCVLANRLSEDPSTNVLLIEAGARDRSMLVHVPLAWTRILQRGLFDWGYASEPEPHLDGRIVPLPRGKLLGGCSSVNAMVYARGHPADYDRWAADGAAGWSYADLLPYFRRGETWEGEADELRGRDGPLPVRRCRYREPFADALARAAEECGLAALPDYNGRAQTGFATLQQTIGNGRRASAAVAYLRPALGRRNLSVALGTQAARIVFRGTRAVGVECEQRGALRTFRASREIVLAAGAYNSPQLLMLSGVGPADELKRLGIAPVHDSPSVGTNLQDHPGVSLDYRRRDDGPFVRELRWDRAALNLLRARYLGTGPASDLPSAGIAFARIDSADRPDIQYLFRATSFGARPWFPFLGDSGANGCGCAVILLHPESRGEVRLTSADPRAPLRIRHNFLARESDRRTLRKGIEFARSIFARPALDPYRAEETIPGAAVRAEADIDAFIRRTCNTVYHPCGTCRMGSDSEAVVDSELRVRGVQGLRVADASVMPTLVSGNINAAVLMIGERASDLIRR